MEKTSEILKLFSSTHRLQRASTASSQPRTRPISNENSSRPHTNSKPPPISIPLTTETQRTLRTDNDPTQLSSNRKSRPKSSLSYRSQSVDKMASYQKHHTMRQWAKDVFAKADIKAISTVRLEGFYKSLCNLRKDENDLKEKINNLQHSSQAGNSSIWNYPEKRTLQRSFESAVSISLKKKAAKLASEEMEKKGLGRSASLEMSPLLLSLLKEAKMPSRESTLANFFKEAGIKGKRKSKEGQGEPVEEGNKQGCHSSINELLGSKSVERGKSLVKMDEIIETNRNPVKLKNIGVLLRQETEVETEKEVEENLKTQSGSGAFESSHKSSRELDSAECFVENRCSHNRSESVLVRQTTGSDGFSPKNAYTMHKRPASAKKRVKAISFSRLVGIAGQEKGELSERKKVLKIGKLGPDYVSHVIRQGNSNANLDNGAFKLVASNQNLRIEPALKIQGQRYGEDYVYGEKGNVRNLRSAEGHRGYSQTTLSHRGSVNDVERANLSNGFRKGRKDVLESWVTKGDNVVFFRTSQVSSNRVAI